MAPNWHISLLDSPTAGAGIIEEQVDAMLVANPRRYFSS
jgi:predicted metal-dependent phosphotriesterase family hydrolase